MEEEAPIEHPDTETGPGPEATGALGPRRFEELVRTYERELRRFCTAVVGDPDVGRDMAQDAFLRLWKARDRYREEGQARALLYTIARNRCRTYLRKRAVRQWVPWTEGDSVDRRPGIDAVMETTERDRAVRRAIGRLPERFRTPVVLRYVDGAEYDFIAEVIGRTPSAARSRVHYGLKKLADILRRERLQ